jgi:hypothetical protein
LGLKGVAITHEQLTIDLRPLAALEPVGVEAIYHLNNSGSSKKLDLLFVTGVTGVSDFEVCLGDRLLESRCVAREDHRSRQGELPKSWEPPDELPGIDSRAARSHIHRRLVETVLLGFSVELPPGPSTLRARYRARAYGEDEDYPTVTWQFPYVLAPAREWASLDRLDVTVYLPEGWQSVAEPALEREGAVLRGSFRGVPGNCLALAVRAPARPDLRAVMYRYWALFGVLVVSGGVLSGVASRLLGRYLTGGRWRAFLVPKQPTFCRRTDFNPFAVGRTDGTD